MSYLGADPSLRPPAVVEPAGSAASERGRTHPRTHVGMIGVMRRPGPRLLWAVVLILVTIMLIVLDASLVAPQVAQARRRREEAAAEEAAKDAANGGDRPTTTTTRPFKTTTTTPKVQLIKNGRHRARFEVDTS